MGKYRTKEIIEAVGYEKGMEDGFSCIPLTMICGWKDENGDFKQCSKCTLDIPKVPYVDSIVGHQYLNEDDYIIHGGGWGSKWPMSKEEFESKYEEVK